MQPKSWTRSSLGNWLIAGISVEIAVVLVGAVAGASLDLRGTPFLLLLIAIVITVDGAVAYGWNRWRPPFHIVGRLVGVVLISAVGALLALDVLNRQEGFYSSFSDLFGSEPQKAAVVKSPDATDIPRLDVTTANWQLRGLQDARLGHGEVLNVRLWGARSHIVRRGYVYLPAAYFTDTSSLRFPVMELLHGQPGGPPNFVRQIAAPTTLDEEIKARRMPPVIAVIPGETAHEVFSECVDAVHGPLNETYLALDVVDDTNATFRTLPGRSWAVAGYSTGGFCSVNLALHHPDRYSVAASLSGYFVAGKDPNTAGLYAHSKAALNRNSPVWWVTHRSPVAPGLYLLATRQDHFAFNQLEAFQAALREHAPQLPRVITILPNGGHNWNVWRLGLRSAFDWMSTFLPMPLSES